MSAVEPNTVQLLSALSAGDTGAGKLIFTRVYDELHAIARRTMKKASPGHLLQTTALVHEVYIKLIPKGMLCCNDRKHFFALAGKAMRQILISDMRNRLAAKRGKGAAPISLDANMQSELVYDNSLPDDLEALNTVIEKMESIPAFKSMCTLVDLRIFAGLSFKQIGEILEVSKAKVIRDWSFVRAMLIEELEKTQ